MSALYFVLQQTMYFAVPLLLVALGAMFSEKSGVTNIALEGIMILGAFVGVLVIRFAGDALSAQLVLACAVCAAALVGLAYSLLLAVISIRFRADQIIGGTALNMLAPALCIFAARGALGVKQVDFAAPFFIEKIPVLGDIPFVGPALFTNCYLTTYFAAIVLLLAIFLLKRTRFGMRLSACGENPEAAASAGINVARMRYAGVLISGVLGGAGGLIFVLTTSTSFTATVVGYGFLALAVLILGQWKPVGILLAALFFGVLKAIASSYSVIPVLSDLDIASEFLKVIPYVLTLVVLALSARKSRAPKAVGKPYDDGKKFLGGLGKRGKIAVCSVLAVVVVAGTAFALEGNEGKRESGRAVSPGFGAEIAMVLDQKSTIDDKSFNQSMWDGVISYTDSTQKTRKYYQAKDSSNEGLLQSIRLAVRGNAKTVVVSSEMFQYALYDAQDAYPDTRFVIVNGVPTDPATREERIADNVVCLSFAQEQGGFLAGYAVVMDGYRSLGFMGGMAVPAVSRYGYGFVAGANQAARELGLGEGSIQIRYCYTGTWSPSPEILSKASSWYSSGTEVIFSCGGGICSSIMKAAETAGGKVIGVDTDQSAESPTVITSVLIDMKSGLPTVIASLESGELRDVRSLRLGAAESVVALPMETSRFQSFSTEDYRVLYDRLVSGQFAVPTDENVSSATEIEAPFVEVDLER